MGDVDPIAFSQSVQAALGEWKGSTAPLEAAPEPPKPPSSTLPVAEQLIKNDPHSSKAAVHFGCRLPAARSLHEVLVGELLSHAISDDIERYVSPPDTVGSDRLMHAHVSFLRGGAQVLYGELEIAPEALPRALARLHAWLDSTGQATVTAELLERARWDNARRISLQNTSNALLSRLLFNDWNMDWPVNVGDNYPEDLAGVDSPEVSAALTACRVTSVISIVAP